MWAPRSSSVSASKITLTSPSLLPTARALPLALKGKRPTRMVRPAWRAASSVSPALAVYARRLEPEVLDVPLHPDGHQYMRALHSARPLGGVHVYLHTLGRDFCMLHPAAHVDRDALLFERLL